MATKKHTIKLLFFSPYFYPYISGLTQYPYRLFTESKLPLETTCLTFKHKSNLGRRDALQCVSTNHSTTTIHRMPFLFRLSKGFISPQSILYFWREIHKNQVVLINLPSVEGAFLALFAKLRGVPIISLLHCEVLLPFSLPNLAINFILNCGVFFQLLVSKKIIVYTTDYYEKKWMYSLFRNKMEVIPPPVHEANRDKEYMNQLNRSTNKYTYTVGFCGRIAAEKGIEILIASVSQIKNALILFAGPTGKDVIGEESYFLKIERLLAEKSIPHQFLGTLSGSKLSSFYKAIDVLALPSLNKTEAFGMVQVEAMLQGTPVIASNLPGVRIPIHKTKMGITTPPGNIEKLTQAILTIKKNKSQYSNPHLIHNAKILFDSQKTYASIYSVIQQCIH